MKSPASELIDYSPQWREELIRMWRASFEFGVGVTDPHPISDQLAYFDAEVLPRYRVRLAVSGSQLVGFVAASRESVAQLYVRVGCHRQGIGSQLLAWAKAQSTGALWLLTFERNRTAQAFYEHHGFTVVARGFEGSWQLNDVKYQWSMQQSPSAA